MQKTPENLGFKRIYIYICLEVHPQLMQCPFSRGTAGSIVGLLGQPLARLKAGRKLLLLVANLWKRSEVGPLASTTEQPVSGVGEHKFSLNFHKQC
jgi:hypothetical protein